MPPDEELPTPGPPLRLGSRIAGRYELVERLGGGGMGEVFRARDLQLRRDVAIKRLLPHLVHREDLLLRSEREGQILASLRHPAIIDVYDVLDSPDGSRFLILELVPGRSLDAELRSVGRLPWSRCVDIGVQICGALTAAHAASVIHRDIKPANILVGLDGSIHVADFGIARLAGSSTATAEGSLIGTPDYWAPEQATGGEITAASDIYSLCCVLFEAACGRPPFVAASDASPAAVFVMHVVRPVPDPQDVAPDLPEEARRILMRGLAKEPSERFPSAESLSAALIESRDAAGVVPTGTAGSDRAVRPLWKPRRRAAGSDETVTPTGAGPEPRPRRFWRRPAFVIGAAAAALLVGAGVGAVAASTDSSGPAVVGTREVATGHIRATVPDDWSARPASAGRLKPFELHNAVELRPSGSAAPEGVVVGTSTAIGPSLLAAGISPSSRSVVRMGDLVGYRYKGLRAGGRRVTAYVAPASDGVTTVLCPAATGDAATDAPSCEGVVSSLRLVGASGFPLGPDPRQTRALRRALLRADSSLALARAIASSSTASGQASAARDVAAGLRGALRSVPASSGASPALRPALGQLRVALRAEASGYEALSQAATAVDSGAWAAAGTKIESGSRRLTRALTALRAAGYSAR